MKVIRSGGVRNLGLLGEFLRVSSIDLEENVKRWKQNTGWKPMLCYINAVASEIQVLGDSSQDGSERSLGSPEDQCSIGFQPVFFRTERCFPTIRHSPPSCV